MLGKTHRMAGIGFGVGTLGLLKVVGCAVNPVTTIGYIAGAGLGSLIPDLDHQGSLLSKELKPIAKVVANNTKHRGVTHYPSTCIVFGIVVSLLAQLLMNAEGFNVLTGILFPCLFSLSMTPIVNLLLSVVDIDIPYLTEKTSKYFLLGIGFILVFLLQNIAIGFAVSILYGSVIGYISHLVLDLFTVGGVPVFGPVIKNNVHLTNCKTGGMIEVVGLAIAFIIACIGIVKF